jgi:hypothetical protein
MNEPPKAPTEANKAPPEEPEDERDEGKTHPFGWVSLIVIATLIVVTYFVVNMLMDDTRMQDCIQSGRRNCAPIGNP